MSTEPSSETKGNFVIEYFRDFKVLKQTTREYWALQGINVLDSIAYFAMFNIVVVMLSEDYGFSDKGAGLVFTPFTLLTTISLFFAGLFSDWFGIRRSIAIAQIGLTVSRAAVVGAVFMPEGTLRNVVVVVSLMFMAPFMSMMQTVYQAGNKRFTTKASRGAGFNLWYMAMNIGAAGGGFVVDIFYLNLHLPRFQLMTMGAVLGLINILLGIMLIRRTDQIYGEGEEPETEDANVNADGERKNPWELTKAVLSNKIFWRFTVLITLLIGVRSVFLYLALLHPKFWLRVIGPDAQIGTLQALNPVLIIIGLIVLIPILNKFNVYKMLVTGALITSSSLFFIALPPFGPFADMEVGRYTYITSIIFLLVLTLGELIWSPRLQEYTAAIAPKGQEGTYLGLSMVPYFLAKTIISPASGYMLERWCPKGIGERLNQGSVSYWDSPYAMWLILGMVALVGTIFAIIFKDWFNPKDVSAKTAAVAH